MEWLELLKDIGLFAIATTAISLLIKYSLDKRTKSLENELSKNLEVLKSELRMISYKREKLHITRFEVISGIYKRIVQLNYSLLDMTAMFKPDVPDFNKTELARIDKAGRTHDDFRIYFEENEIFISDDTAGLLNKLMKESLDSIWEYSYEKTYGLKNPDDYMKIVDRVQKQIPEIMNKLKEDFRKAIDE